MLLEEVYITNVNKIFVFLYGW